MRRDGRYINVLVVEDNPGDFLLIEEYLLESFETPAITHSERFAGVEKIFTTGSPAFNLILLDLSLPDLSGEALITNVLDLAADIPVIVLTGYSDIAFSIKSLSMGVSDYLLKDDLTEAKLYKSISYSIERRATLLKLKESERKYRDMFQLSPLPLFVFDLETLRFLDVNHAAVSHYGYSKMEFLEMTIGDIRPKEDIPILEETLRTYQKYQENEIRGVYRHMKKDGTIILVELKYRNVEFAGRKSRIILANDITLRLEKEAALEEANKLLVSIEEEERRRFASEVHDGIAQNLVSMNLFFQLYEDADKPESIEKYSKIIKKTIQDTIQECRNISRNAQPKDLIDNGLCYTLETLAKQIRDTGKCNVNLSCNTNIDGRLSNYMQFILFRIMQENFNNAIKHSGANRIDLGMHIVGDQLFASFNDDGNGISPEVLNAKSSFLSIRRRVGALKGKFDIISEPGKGTEFKYTFPLETNHNQDGVQRASDPTHEKSQLL